MDHKHICKMCGETIYCGLSLCWVGSDKVGKNVVCQSCLVLDYHDLVLDLISRVVDSVKYGDIGYLKDEIDRLRDMRV